MEHKIEYYCDVWSIGCTIFQLITGKQLFIVSKINELLLLIDRTLGSFTDKQRKYITSDNNNPRIDLPAAKYDRLQSNVENIEILFYKIEKEDEDLYKVIKRMLTIDSVERISLGTATDYYFLDVFRRYI